MRRLRFTLAQIMGLVAVAGLILWAGILAQDFFRPPCQLPLMPISEPELPDGQWFPAPFIAMDMMVYQNLDDLAKNIRPPRTIVFCLDTTKRRWVRNYKAEELLQTPPERPKPNIVPGRAWWLER
jgi:hypothetical protein